MASVLKQAALLPGTHRSETIAFNLEDVQQRAHEILEEARLQAERLLSDAQRQARETLAAAKEQGLAEAQQEIDQRVERTAQQLSDTRCRTAIAACENTVQQLAKETAKWLTAYRDQTIELAAKIAEKIVRREMLDNEEVLRVWMEEAIVAMRDMRDIRVIVHPDDFAIAGRFLQQLSKSVPQAASVQVLPDPQVEPGGCLVKSSHGQIDQQLEIQLQRLVQQLS